MFRSTFQALELPAILLGPVSTLALLLTLFAANWTAVPLPGLHTHGEVFLVVALFMTTATISIPLMRVYKTGSVSDKAAVCWYLLAALPIATWTGMTKLSLSPSATWWLLLVLAAVAVLLLFLIPEEHSGRTWRVLTTLAISLGPVVVVLAAFVALVANVFGMGLGSRPLDSPQGYFAMCLAALTEFLALLAAVRLFEVRKISGAAWEQSSLPFMVFSLVYAYGNGLLYAQMATDNELATLSLFTAAFVLGSMGTLLFLPAIRYLHSRKRLAWI